jgi:hypothetical protein
VPLIELLLDFKKGTKHPIILRFSTKMEAKKIKPDRNSKLA